MTPTQAAAISMVLFLALGVAFFNIALHEWREALCPLARVGAGIFAVWGAFLVLIAAVFAFCAVGLW
jgi:hypothetical protein